MKKLLFILMIRLKKCKQGMIIDMKENKYLEFKSEITNTFLKTVSAYANFGDGKILFGVADDGTPLGIEDAETACLDIENKINDSITPKPDFELSFEELPYDNSDLEFNILEEKMKETMGLNSLSDDVLRILTSVLKQYDKALELYKRYYQYEEISGVQRKNIQLIPATAFREAVANALIQRSWDMKSHIRVV